MNRCEGFNCFKFNDKTIFDQEIQPSFTDMRTFVDDRNWCLRDIGYVPYIKFDCQSSLVHTFKKSWS